MLAPHMVHTIDLYNSLTMKCPYCGVGGFGFFYCLGVHGGEKCWFFCFVMPGGAGNFHRKILDYGNVFFLP